ncbi:MAG TPA: PIG-L family deacetylase [Gemmatimonadaceae bacterium]|nr:PIG-L family deacetylase [Gemmatimonadaceae bacterium]
MHPALTHFGLPAGTVRNAAPPPRALVLAAHPDDETIGAGARLPLLRNPLVVHVTDGAPRDLRDAHAHGHRSREAYAAARRDELCAALALAGVTPDHLRSLGAVDQEASLAMAPLARLLATLLCEHRPDVVLVHAYEGGHPDHDAAALIAHAAVALLARDGVSPPPLVEMACYHARGSEAVRGDFLPDAHRATATIELSAAERTLKRRMRDCFASQREVLAPFPLHRERFRLAPRHRFGAPPHQGALHYEWYDWGMTGARWRALARDALATLDLEQLA